ncbi:MAG: YqaA family protein [Candidatus Latescibacterota bacterium]
MVDAGVVRKGVVRRMYNWVLHWSETPYGPWALFVLAFMESSFFPIPPDVLLIALALGLPKRAFRFALMCTVGSVLGGMFGYFIGASFFDLIGHRILEFYGALDKFAEVQNLYNEFGVWVVGIAGFTPIPYKVFTIASGVFHMDFAPFVLVSFFTRGTRFFIVAGLIWKFGTPIKNFIDKYFDVLSIAFVIILLLGFAAVKFFF